MKTVYNSAYVLIRSLNSTFAWQAVIVNFYLYSNFQEIAMPNVKYLCTSRLFLPVISDCKLIASKKSIRPFTYTEILLLLATLVQINRIFTRSAMNAKTAPAPCYICL